MNHEQAMLMKSSRVSDLNTPWAQVLHLASRRVSQAAHHRRFEYGIALFLLYPFGDRAAGLCRSQRRGTDDPVRRGGTLMNVPTIIAGDIKRTLW